MYPRIERTTINYLLADLGTFRSFFVLIPLEVVE